MSTKPAGERSLEVILGLIMLAAALCLWGFFVVVLLKGKFNLDDWLIYSVVIVFAFWFSRLSFRLVLNKRRIDGALFSPWAINVWKVIFVLMFPIAVYMQYLEGSIFFATASLIVMCMVVASFLISKYRRKSNE